MADLTDNHPSAGPRAPAERVLCAIAKLAERYPGGRVPQAQIAAQSGVTGRRLRRLLRGMNGHDVRLMRDTAALTLIGQARARQAAQAPQQFAPVDPDLEQFILDAVKRQAVTPGQVPYTAATLAAETSSWTVEQITQAAAALDARDLLELHAGELLRLGVRPDLTAPADAAGGETLLGEQVRRRVICGLREPHAPLAGGTVRHPPAGWFATLTAIALCAGEDGTCTPGQVARRLDLYPAAARWALKAVGDQGLAAQHPADRSWALTYKGAVMCGAIRVIDHPSVRPALAALPAARRTGLGLRPASLSFVQVRQLVMTLAGRETCVGVLTDPDSADAVVTYYGTITAAEVDGPHARADKPDQVILMTVDGAMNWIELSRRRFTGARLADHHGHGLSAFDLRVGQGASVVCLALECLDLELPWTLAGRDTVAACVEGQHVTYRLRDGTTIQKPAGRTDRTLRAVA